MEIAAGWGRTVYARLRAVDTPPGWKSPIRFLATANGEEFGSIESLGFEGPRPEVSPAEPVMSSQDLIEVILREAAEATGLVDLRFGHRVDTLLRGGDGHDAAAAVAVTDLATGDTYEEAGAAVVADGATSAVREQLAIPLQGTAPSPMSSTATSGPTSRSTSTGPLACCCS